MVKFDEMDEKVTLAKQLEENVSPVILINKFNVKPEEADQFLKAWADDAAYFKSQPRFISAQLHRGIGGQRCLRVFKTYGYCLYYSSFSQSLAPHSQR